MKGKKIFVVFSCHRGSAARAGENVQVCSHWLRGDRRQVFFVALVLPSETKYRIAALQTAIKTSVDKNRHLFHRLGSGHEDLVCVFTSGMSLGQSQYLNTLPDPARDE